MVDKESGVAQQLLETFEHNALAGGAQVSVVADQIAAAQLIAATSDGAIRCTEAARELYPLLYGALEEAGNQPAVAEAHANGEPDRSALAVALAGGTGIVVAHAGVAETGSVVLADDALAPRLLGMLSEVCVVLLSAQSIVPGLDEAGALLAEMDHGGHRYISLVTGPSRTADIERVLTIGVQGPKALHIIVLQEKES
jgi:L-lactate dehydrogenase complex protein LldG